MARRCWAAWSRWQHGTPGGAAAACPRLQHITRRLVECAEAEAARALAPASPSYDAHRQRSCGIAGRTCDLCGRYRSQWPGGRPCIGNSRLTTGEGMDRSTTATVQAASGRKWSEQRAQPITIYVATDSRARRRSKPHLFPRLQVTYRPYTASAESTPEHRLRQSPRDPGGDIPRDPRPRPRDVKSRARQTSGKHAGKRERCINQGAPPRP